MSSPPNAPPRWPVVQSPIPQDPEIEAAVAALVAEMSLEQKVGQMIQAEIRSITPEQVRRFHIGSVLNGGGAWPGQRMDATAADWVALADAYYEASMDTSDGGLPIPVIWGTDAVHGHSNVMGATLFPHNIGLGAAGDPELIERIGAITAREVAATGLDWTFAPTLAVVRDDRWGRTYESYSEAPEIVRAYAGRMVEGLQGRAGGDDLLGVSRVLATAKHFLADGGTTGGVDQGDAAISERELIDLHAQGYLTALAAGAQTVMASFSSWNGDKMHGNRYLLTEILRGPLGFDGLVVGDWNGHGQLPGCSNDRSAAAILAGVDLLMVPDDWEALIENTLAQVRSGEIPAARIDQAVTRILRVKMRAGLMGPRQDRGRPSSRPLAGDASALGCDAHRAVAREAVRRSLVLLKNRGGALPLSAGGRFLVVGRGAHDVGMQSGGWTLTWQGSDTTRADFPRACSIYEGLAAAADAAGGAADLSVDGAAAGPGYDAIVAVIGEAPYAEGQGDIPAPGTLEHALRHPEDRALLDHLRAAAPGVPVITVLLTGRPLYVNPELNRSDAFVVAWLPGGEGAGIADVLFGDFDFAGRLSFSWPGRDVDVALNRGDPQALFPYGFGLDYTTPDALGDDLPEARTPGGLPAPSADVEIFTRGAGRNQQVMVLASGGGRVEIGAVAETPDGAVRAEAVDGRIQGSALRIHWSAPGEVRCEGPALDLRPLGPAAALRFRARLLSRGGEVEALGLSLRAALASSTPGQWCDVRLPASRLASLGLDLAAAAPAFAIRGAAGTTIELEDVRWEAAPAS